MSSNREEQYKKLHQEYTNMLSQSGSGSQGVGLERFIKLLEDQRMQLIEQHKCRDVVFSVVMRNNKPAIQPQLITAQHSTQTGMPKAVPKTTDDPDRDVFEAYLKIRRECGQVADGFVFKDFKTQLDASRRSCMEKFGWNSVEFDVVNRNGKAAILPRRGGTIPGMAGLKPGQAQPRRRPAPPASHETVQDAKAAPKQSPKVADPSQIPALEKALRVNRQDATLIEALADAYQAAGNIERAKELYGQAEGLYHDKQDLAKMDEVGRKLRKIDRQPTTPPSSSKSNMIAVLELNPALSNFIGGFITAIGKKKDTINSVNDLFDKVKPAYHAALIMDFDLGGRNPYAVCSRLKSFPDTASVPLIAIMPEGTTQETIKQDKQSSWAAQAYIVKPLDKEKLISAFRKIGLA
ncbi:MAG: hypothetical protein GXP49_17185 [Deltaproteobacteria bacterium]|nr:hypothetical protein [Deltaproteobacteria bacterium]